MQDLHGIKILLSPVQQFTGLILTPFGLSAPSPRHDQATLTVHGRKHQVKSGLDVCPVFSPSTFMVLTSEQTVTVCCAIRPSQALFCTCGKLRLAVDDGSGQNGQSLRGAVLAQHQTMNGFEVRIAQIQLLHIVVHHLHELRLATGHVIRQRHTGVVNRINNQTAAEVAHRKRGTLFPGNISDEPSNTGLPCPRVAPPTAQCSSGNAVAIISAVNVAGHQLGETRRLRCWRSLPPLRFDP